MVVDRRKGAASPAMTRGLTSRAKLTVAPKSSEASLHVAVRIRPILKSGVRAQEAHQKDIIRVMSDRVVIVLDPDEQKDYLDKVQGRTKEKKYTFDIAFGTDSRNCDIYDGTIRELVLGCMNGLNVTVFAYGATGSGKTYTMVGSDTDPGLMVLSLERIFRDREDLYGDEDFEVTSSYIEVYNEMIYDLLVKNSGPLELREDPRLGVQVAGIKRHKVSSPAEILLLLQQGNTRRKTESTNANATSSRSHAVLEINIVRKPRNQYKSNLLRGKLSLVDLAGSERAAETNNAGQKLRDGANINRSLLALANCINALGKQGKKGMAYVPYRNSKLTRLLKDGLSGNSKTAMIATVSCSADQYHHSINTLKYADRAKEIKTHISKNVGTVETHVSDYQKIIDNLQGEVQNLKEQLETQQATGNQLPSVMEEVLASPADRRQEEEAQMKWLDSLSAEINENTEERINLQKALFELEDTNVCNKGELQHLEDYLASGQASKAEAVEARQRIKEMRDNIVENEETGFRYRADIEANEEQRRSIQDKINIAMETHRSSSFLQVLSTFRMQAVRLQELQFQMAVRDQVISEQRDVISNLWRVIEGAGLDREQIQAIAFDQGILVEGLGNPEPEVNGGAPDGPVKAAFEGSPRPRTPKARGQPPGGVNNKSIYGARAQYRYDFWHNYEEGGDPMDDSPSQSEERPSTSQSDRDVRYQSPGRQQGTRGVVDRQYPEEPNRNSDENLSAARRRKSSRVSGYDKSSPAKASRGRGLPRGEVEPPSPREEASYDMDDHSSQPEQRSRTGAHVQHGRRGGSSRYQQQRAPDLSEENSQRMKTITSAWTEEGADKSPEFMVGNGKTRYRERESESGEAPKRSGALGRLRGRLASGRAPTDKPAPPHSISQPEIDSLRIDAAGVGEPHAPAAARETSASSARRKSHMDRLKGRSKPRMPSATSLD